jgi:G3E family GTPase
MRLLCTVKERARILRSQYGRIPLSLILDINLSDLDTTLDSETHQNQNAQRLNQHLNKDGFMSVSFQSNRPIALKRFQQFLDYQLPDNVFRAKGILWFAESPKRHLFQLSGKRFTLDDSEWTTAPKNQMVLIGRKLDALVLIQTLNNCLTQ